MTLFTCKECGGATFSRTISFREVVDQIVTIEVGEDDPFSHEVLEGFPRQVRAHRFGKTVRCEICGKRHPYPPQEGG